MISISVSHTAPGLISERIDRLVKTRTNGSDISVIHRGLDRAGQRVYKDARVKTGYMRSTIEVRRSTKDVSVSVGAYYSFYIERGTDHHRAFPFFFANIYAEMDKIRSEFRALYIK